MYKVHIILVLVFCCLAQTFAAHQSKPEKLVIGVVSTPPFFFSDNGKPSGVCNELWRMIADSLNLSGDFVFYPNDESLLGDLRSGKLDISVSPFTATTERLNYFRLSIPFYISNMGIVSRAENQKPLLQVLKNIFSWTVIRWLVIVLLVVSVFAFFLWLAERKTNSLQFHPGPQGVLDGIWWAFVTMTTVGYGDKIPKTSMGKILAITWMFFAIGLFFLASGVISSELTLNKLQSRVQNSDDLIHCRVGAVSHSGYAETLSRQGIDPVLFKTPEEGIKALENDSVDAFVYDLAWLNFSVDRDKKEKKLVVIASGLNLQYFSFLASKKNSELVDRINPVLLSAIDGNSWREILSRYGLNK